MFHCLRYIYGMNILFQNSQRLCQYVIAVIVVVVVVVVVYRSGERHVSINTNNVIRGTSLSYHPPINRTITGKPFYDVDLGIFSREMDFQPISLDAHSVKDLVLVTALSEEFFYPLKILVETVQHHLPQAKIIVYSMGIFQRHKNVNAATWCKFSKI